MIIGIGCDIVMHEETDLLEWSSNLQVLKKYFSKIELETQQGDLSTRFISGRFAVKEAVAKCLGTAIVDGIGLDDIHVLQNEDGQPFIKVTGEVEELSNKLGIDSWHISITHSKTQSVAFVIAEGRKA